MFEEPQYLTPDGFRRIAKNPHGKRGKEKSLFELVQEEKRRKASCSRPAKGDTGKGLSDEAAALIAQALKTMLR